MSKLIVGVNDLATVRPDLIKEWAFDKNELNPNAITIKSNKKVWWICKKGHKYQATIVHRTVDNTGCPYCSNRKVLKGYNDLATLRLDLIKEWNYEKNGNLAPDMVTCGSKKKVWWLCNKGHEWKASIVRRTEGTNCPYCFRQKNRVKSGYNDLATVRPGLVKEWDFEKNELSPNFVCSHSKKEVWWKCEKGHSYLATVNLRFNGGTCPYCAKTHTKLLSGFNDLDTVYPNLVKYFDKEKNDFTSNAVVFNSSKLIFWKCEKGHSWKSTIYAINRNGVGCPYCRGKKVFIGFNDLLTTHLDLCKEWDYKKNKLSPSDVSAGSNKVVWWVCSNGHSFEASVYNRAKENGSNCPYCVKKNYKNRLIYNFKTNLVIKEYYQCECQKCGYFNILTIDEMKQHYDECFGKE